MDDEQILDGDILEDEEKEPTICDCGECKECVENEGKCECGDCDMCIKQSELKEDLEDSYDDLEPEDKM